MDRYDRIMRDILDRTKNGALDWKVWQGNEDLPVRYLRDEDHVRQSFLADYPLGSRLYRLYFAERRFRRSGESFYFPEVSEYELYVLSEGWLIVLTLSDGVVDRDDLLRLAGLVFDRNDQVRDFFKAFDELGAA